MSQKWFPDFANYRRDSGDKGCIG
ncbi:hypothetical protein [Acutalibacter muris]